MAPGVCPAGTLTGNPADPVYRIKPPVRATGNLFAWPPSTRGRAGRMDEGGEREAAGVEEAGDEWTNCYVQLVSLLFALVL